MEAIGVENLVKKYQNGVQALNGLNLTVKSGEIFSLLGQNGAGKSTLINILTTYLKPSSGNVTMFGKDLYKEASDIRVEIACVAQRVSIDTHLSLKENMMFQSKLYKIPKTEAVKRMEGLIEAFDLKRYEKYPVSSYSGGVKRRLDIAINMMSNPKILFMDEPTTGMDIQSRMAMWNMMRKIRSDFGVTIFLTTHYLEEADKLSDTICIIKDGKEIIQGTPMSLKKYLKKDMIKINFLSKDDAKGYVDKLDTKRARLQGESIVLDVEEGFTELKHINSFLLQSGVNFTGISIIQSSLEDVFLSLTKGGSI